MANRISIRSGAGTPTTSHLIDKELGFNTTDKALYINDNGTIRSLGGIPSGGTTGQGIRKKSNTDGDIEWADIDAATLDGLDSTAFFRKLPEVDSNQDFNLLIAPGCYSIGTATNHVNGPGFSMGAIFVMSSATYTRQEAWSANGTTRKTRFYNGSAWTAWSLRGVPSGGTTGQGLVKNSNTDGDIKWADVDAATLDGLDSTSFFRKMTALPSTQDFNSLLAPGCYPIGDATNYVNDPGFSAGVLFVMNAGSYTRQEAWSANGVTKKTRYSNGATWTVWSVLMNGVDQIYPVGSIYLSVNSTNPGTLFGGTWAAWGTGKVPVGVGTGTDANSTSQSFAAGETGGEYTHTLTVAEMPYHSHTILLNSASSASYDTWDYSYGASKANRNYYSQTPAEPIVGGAGSSGAHNNMPPYITCYMWKRTA